CKLTVGIALQLNVETLHAGCRRRRERPTLNRVRLSRSAQTANDESCRKDHLLHARPLPWV
ncbi:MAG TPA: hypothetical protein PK109_03120, partial [Candidatus Paceibacterota bacterium]|nr:hypothetical protein [Candidatus Paceibacterota bacterium]